MKASEVTTTIASILERARANTTLVESMLALHRGTLEELEVLANRPAKTETVAVDVEDDLPIDEALKQIVDEFRKQGSEIEAALKQNTVEGLAPEGPQGGQELPSTTATAPVSPVNEAPKTETAGADGDAAIDVDAAMKAADQSKGDGA